MADFHPGDIVRVSTTPGFKDAVGVLADPTTVTLKWRAAGGTTTTWTWTSGTPGPNIVRDSIGLFHADITVVSAGLHYFRWEGSGSVTAAEESTFSVETWFVA